MTPLVRNVQNRGAQRQGAGKQAAGVRGRKCPGVKTVVAAARPRDHTPQKLVKEINISVRRKKPQNVN